MDETDQNLGVSSNTGIRSAIAAKLSAARHELLDLSTRNRLISTSRHSRSSRLIEISAGDSDGIYRELVTDGRAIGFAAREPEDDTGELGAGPEEGDALGPARSRREMRLQTSLTSPLPKSRLIRRFRR
jgi:hypothetical protein